MNDAAQPATEMADLQREAYRLRQLAPVQEALTRYEAAVRCAPSGQVEARYHEVLDAMRTAVAGLDDT